MDVNSIITYMSNHDQFLNPSSKVKILGNHIQTKGNYIYYQGNTIFNISFDEQYKI